MKIRPEIKLAFEKRVEEMKQDPRLGKGVTRVETRVVYGYMGEATAGEFTFISDEKIESGGTNKGPSPLQYFLAGFAFCEQVIFIRHAAAAGLNIDGLELSVRGYFDRRGIWGTADVDPGFQEIIVEMKINSQENEERIKEAVQRVHRHCPAYNTMRKTAKISERIYLNGKPIELS